MLRRSLLRTSARVTAQATTSKACRDRLSAFFRSWQPIGVSSATRTAIRPLMAFDGSSLGSFRDQDDTMLCTPQKDKQSRYALIVFPASTGRRPGEGPGKGAPCL